MVNRVTLLGYLGRDAETRYTAGGAAVCTFNLATSERWKDKQGRQQERTEWHRCVLWGPAGEKLAEYLHKGKQVYVEGSIQTRKYDKNGQTHYATEIKIDQIRLLGAKGGNGQQSRPARGRQQAQDPAELDTPIDTGSEFGGGDSDSSAAESWPADDDIPF